MLPSACSSSDSCMFSLERVPCSRTWRRSICSTVCHPHGLAHDHVRSGGEILSHVIVQHVACHSNHEVRIPCFSRLASGLQSILHEITVSILYDILVSDGRENTIGYHNGHEVIHEDDPIFMGRKGRLGPPTAHSRARRPISHHFFSIQPAASCG